MKEIALTQGRFALVDDADYKSLAGYRWYAVRHESRWYAARRNGSASKLYMHRAIYPEFAAIDHIDGDGLNNQRSNLRPASRQQNARNAKKHAAATSAFKGVYLHKSGKWYAQLKVRDESKWLGAFVSEAEAARAYDRAARQFFGEFAQCNFSKEASATYDAAGKMQVTEA